MSVRVALLESDAAGLMSVRGRPWDRDLGLVVFLVLEIAIFTLAVLGQYHRSDCFGRRQLGS